MSYSHLFPRWVLHLVVYKTGGLETLASLNAPTISSVSTTCFLRFTLSKIKHWQRELCCAKQELISGKADWATYKPLNGVNTSLLINHTTTLYSAPFFTQRIPSGNYFTLKWSNYGRKWWKPTSLVKSWSSLLPEGKVNSELQHISSHTLGQSAQSYLAMHRVPKTRSKCHSSSYPNPFFCLKLKSPGTRLP